MKLKLQRNTWIFAGICFGLGIIFSIYEAKPFGVYYILTGITSILSFINAYKVHKKMLH
ncbi:hypothetical protein [Clostridium ganghwense]|uniref:Uncharacterized protein n=1 Tax=Clostridium ganghwense TaxID=312089 RepID=A0ABT4CU91_9CLOT|nr:hypothetical protein [Clostridium ganghwense]MCY6372640.1 hypothetical protein [Clostridium ganghwense]